MCRSANPVIYDDAEGKGMRFEAAVRAVAEGGEVRAEGTRSAHRDARAVTLLIAASTGYRGFDRDPAGRPRRSAQQICRTRIGGSAAESPTWHCARRTLRIIRRLFRPCRLEAAAS